MRDNFDHAPRPENGQRWPKKHLRRPGGGRPRKALNPTISIDEPEKNSTLGSVNVEGTEPEHATLFTVRGLICGRPDNSFESRSELLGDCGATNAFMSTHTAKRAQLAFYKLTKPGQVLTARGSQVEVRYYTRAYVWVGESLFRHPFKVLEILPDVLLALPWPRNYNSTVDSKKSYADARHGLASYLLSSDASRHSTQLQFQAASKLDLLSTLSPSTSNVSPVGSPTSPAKEHPDLHSWTRAKSDADTLDESEIKDGTTDEECSDMEIEYISLPKLKREIHRADFTGDQLFLCCMPRPAVPVDQMYNMQESRDNNGLDPVRRKLPIQIQKRARLYDPEGAEFGDLPPHRSGRQITEYAWTLKTIHCG